VGGFLQAMNECTTAYKRTCAGIGHIFTLTLGKEGTLEGILIKDSRPFLNHV
jgi:hypothetical protein